MDLRRFSLVRTVDPAVQIMTVADAKLHLRIDTSAEDSLVSALIDAATAAIEAYTHRALITQTWRMSIDRFPYPYPGNGSWSVDPLFIQQPAVGGWLAMPIYLPRPNLLAVSSITYLDLTGSQQTLSPSVYTVNTDELPGTVSLSNGQSWPNALYLRNSIQITYTAGFGPAAANIPAPIIHAAKLMIADFYTNREAALIGTRAATVQNLAVDALLSQYVVRELP